MNEGLASSAISPTDAYRFAGRSDPANAVGVGVYFQHDDQSGIRVRTIVAGGSAELSGNVFTGTSV